MNQRLRLGMNAAGGGKAASLHYRAQAATLTTTRPLLHACACEHISSCLCYALQYLIGGKQLRFSRGFSLGFSRFSQCLSCFYHIFIICLNIVGFSMIYSNSQAPVSDCLYARPKLCQGLHSWSSRAGESVRACDRFR